MSGSAVTAVAAIAAALILSAVAGALHNRRSGVIRHTSTAAAVETADLGLSDTEPTIVHFTAVWCGPCAAVRRVVDQVCADLPGVAHIEIDMDANPDAARRLGVLSLPTTFIFDADGKQRFRTSGVPKAADLRGALEPLLD